MPDTTLRSRINGRQARAETKLSIRLLDELEEKVLIQHIVDLNDQGFSLQLKNIEDMVNTILVSHYKPPISKLWMHQLMKRTSELKIRFSHSYDYQRAQCEDSKLLEVWFQCIANAKSKYGIQDSDIWYFDETEFMIEVISSSMIVTKADRKGKRKRIQPDN